MDTASPWPIKSARPDDVAVATQPISDSRADVFRSLGDEIIFSQADHLYTYAPGDAKPKVMYSAPHGSYIVDACGSVAGYAILTQVTPQGSVSFQWQLWYLDQPLGVPVLVDEFDNDEMPLPTMAMDAGRIAWNRTRGTGDDVVSELMVVGVEELHSPRKLLEYPAFDTNVEHPALNGNELWFGIRDNDWEAGTEHPRIEMLDLDHPETPPAVYGEAERAFMPAVNSDFVAWKGGGLPADSADAYGSLYVYSRSVGDLERVAGIGWPSKADDDRILNPSLGNRFVAWWDFSAQVNIFDLNGRAVVHVVDQDPDTSELRASVAGNLLAFESRRDGEIQLSYAWLPE